MEEGKAERKRRLEMKEECGGNTVSEIWGQKGSDLLKVPERMKETTINLD